MEENKEVQKRSRSGVARHPADVERFGRHSDAPEAHYRIPDPRIFEHIRGRFTEQVGLDLSHVSVTVHEGEATLEGRVESAYTRELLESLCRETAGVQKVHNQLDVRPDPQELQISRSASAHITEKGKATSEKLRDHDLFPRG